MSIKRRAYLQRIGAATLAGAFAGCSGSNSETEAVATTKTVAKTTTQTTINPAALSAEEWRKHASREAAKELQGDQELLLYTSTRSELYRNALANAEYTGIYEPLDGKLKQSAATSSKLETRYRRELKTGTTTTADLLDATPADMISNGVPFMDLGDIPSFSQAPDTVVWDPYLGAQYINGQGIAYNTDRVDEPPNSYEDLLDDRFADGEIAADMTPSASVVGAFYTEHGEEFVRKFRTQQPEFINSKFAMTKAAATGETKIALFPLLPHIQAMKNDGLPIEYVPNPDVWYWWPKSVVGSAKAPHPWAAKLWVDWIMHPDRVDLQVTRPGANSIDGKRANPQELAELFDPAKDEVWTGNEFDRPIAEIERDYLKAIGAPT